MNDDFPFDYENAQHAAIAKWEDHGAARQLRDLLREIEEQRANAVRHSVHELERDLEGATAERLKRLATRSVSTRIPGWKSGDGSHRWGETDPSTWFHYQCRDGEGDRIYLTNAGRLSYDRDLHSATSVAIDASAGDPTEVSARAD